MLPFVISWQWLTADAKTGAVGFGPWSFAVADLQIEVNHTVSRPVLLPPENRTLITQLLCISLAICYKTVCIKYCYCCSRPHRLFGTACQRTCSHPHRCSCSGVSSRPSFFGIFWARDTPRDFYLAVTWPCSFATLRHINQNSFIIILLLLIILLCHVHGYMTGLHQQLVDEAQEHRRDMDTIKDRLVSTGNELSQSSSHIVALEEAIEAERTSHIQTKFSCELLQVSRDTVFVSCMGVTC